MSPITKLEEVTVPPPSAEYIASLSIKAWLTLFSWNIIRLVSSAYNFCIDPLDGSTLFVISSPIENTLVSLIPVLELNIPEYIIEFTLIEAFGLSSTKYALTPSSTCVLLYPPVILDSSTAQLTVLDTAGLAASGYVLSPLEPFHIGVMSSEPTVFLSIKLLKYLTSITPILYYHLLLLKCTNTWRCCSTFLFSVSIKLSNPSSRAKSIVI